MSDTDPCVVCLSPGATTLGPTTHGGIHQVCQRCGEFEITSRALSLMSGGVGKDIRAKLSGWIRDQYSAGSTPKITGTVYDNVVARAIPSIAERANRLLLEAARGQTEYGERFDSSEPRFMAATYSSKKSDLSFLMRFLHDDGLIEDMAMGGMASISPRGYIELEKKNKNTSGSIQGFIAMWFDDDLNEAYTDGFQKGVLEAGYNPLRIDRVEHINRIDDEIIVQIDASRFVVADFTGHRGGVYFEAGYALGSNKPVIWTCRKDHIGELHFDIRQFNCIDWQTPEELSERLKLRIEAVIGPGPQ